MMVNNIFDESLFEGEAGGREGRERIGSRLRLTLTN